MSKLKITLEEILDEGKCSDCILKSSCDSCEEYHLEHDGRSKTICDFLEEVQEEE